MADATSLKNQFLIAMPGLDDGLFDHSVTLMCEHNGDGALGLVINRPTDVRLTTMLTHLDVAHDALKDANTILYWGGPVAPQRGFVIHDTAGAWESCLQLADDLYITTSRDILDAIGRGEGPAHYLVALGYAGWGAGQLEEELCNNAWLNSPFDRTLLFSRPARERWRAATELLGIDARNLSSLVGHA